MSHEYENTRRIVYDCDDHGDAQFIPVCEKCGLFVKANDIIEVNSEGLSDKPNAICSRCGPTKMLFEGFF